LANNKSLHSHCDHVAMETRSRRRVGADPGSTERLPESPITRSSSDETLNLTMIMGDRAAG